MIIRSISDCCEFIAEWLELKKSYPSNQAPSMNGMPSCIKYLNDHYGQLWFDTKHPMKAVLNSSGQALTLFEYQDNIIDPKSYQMDDEGIVTFINENQGVWSFGFNPSDPDQLYVCGDWMDGIRAEFGEHWRKMDATVEDALIFTLLGNLCLMCAREEDWDFCSEEKVFDVNKDIQLWKHPAWGQWDGFVTDKERTFVRYSQNNLTVKRRSWPG